MTLLRHAKSGGDDLAMRDFDRALNDKGRRAAALMGRHIAVLGLGFDRVVASPARRVIETLAEVEAGCGRSLSPVWDRRLYLASAATLLEVVNEQDETDARVLLVGHNPGLQDLVLDLAAPGDLRDEVERKYPTASLAEMTLEGRWADLGRGGAMPTRFVRPRDLDPSLGPDYA